MKKLLPIFIMAFLIFNTGHAQTDVSFVIKHKLGDAAFQMNTGAQNNIGHDFNFTRIDYYVSGIVLVHDGGTETAIEDQWILAKAGTQSVTTLGNLDITNLETVRFNIGVQEDYNHLDPAIYQSDHPLAPKFPSMHWGWTPGYRFVALEGKGGANYNQDIGLHGLHDANYFEVELNAEMSATDGDLTIELEADYTRALENIQVNGGSIAHGVNGDDKTVLENFRDYVFSIQEVAVSVGDEYAHVNFDVFPNPSSDGKVTILSDLDKLAAHSLRISDVIGRDVMIINSLSNSRTDIFIERSGIYMVQLIKDGQSVKTTKLIIE